MEPPSSGAEAAESLQQDQRWRCEDEKGGRNREDCYRAILGSVAEMQQSQWIKTRHRSYLGIERLIARSSQHPS